MIKLQSNTKVFIIAPYYKTGGPRSLHQLGSQLANMGVESYMVYHTDGAFSKQDTILYADCQAQVTDFIEDNSNNILIVSENQTGVLLQFKKIQKVVWWLSLDFYFTQSVFGAARHAVRRNQQSKFLVPAMALHMIRKNPQFRKRNRYARRRELLECYHLYNCEYVANYLRKIRVVNERMAYLCGPLEESYLDVPKESLITYKRDIVVYNPAKTDSTFLEKIKMQVQGIDNTIKFIPIENMSREEVYETLRQAKVYIDFGFFPGPERMPREAVSLHCLIITSNIGSASNDIDVAIPQKHKFTISDKNVLPIANLISNMICGYESYLAYDDKYREKVGKQIINFNTDINSIFERIY